MKILLLALLLQTPDPVLTAFAAAVQAATEPQNEVLRLEAANSDRVVLCTLTDEALTCFRSIESWTADRSALTAIHSPHVEYETTETPLADILAAERAWLAAAD